MSHLKEIYHLKNDHKVIDSIQEDSLKKINTEDFFLGYTIENNLLFGTKEWFHAVESGDIKRTFVDGKITRVYMSGHGDFPEFEITSVNGISKWMRMGEDSAYIVGKSIKLIYVEQKYRRPILNSKTTNCVYKILIEE